MGFTFTCLIRAAVRAFRLIPDAILRRKDISIVTSPHTKQLFASGRAKYFDNYGVHNEKMKRKQRDGISGEEEEVVAEDESI